MYLSGLSGCDDVNALLKTGGPFSQDFVSRVWDAASLPLPAPLVPSSMVGFYAVRPPRGKPVLAHSKNVSTALKAAAKRIDGAHPATSEEMDFMNFWNAATEDPCRKLTPVQKVADAIIKVATVVVPAAGYFQAATDVVNAGAAMSNKGEAANLASRVMTPAINQQIAVDNSAALVLENAKQDAFEAQLKALQSQASTPAALLPTSQSTSQISYPAAASPPKKYFGLTGDQAIVALLALVGVAAIYRSA